MPIAAVVLLVFLSSLVLGYLALRFNALWVYRLFDRSLKNDRRNLALKYQVPAYYTASPDGRPDMSSKWPGWDGWYFFVLPADHELPLKMIRCSLMTGLYGLNGVDNYQKLRSAKLTSFDSIEYLTLSPEDRCDNGTKKRNNNLSQHYLPREPGLTMKTSTLDTAICTGERDSGAGPDLYGKISGAWPDFTFDFADGQTGLRCKLKYHGDSVVWWADVPNVFTYFAAFGQLEGEVSVPSHKGGHEGAGANSPASPPQVYSVTGPGAFEHGFGRKPFNYDVPWLPVRLWQKMIPAWNPVRYNYQVFIGDKGPTGGFMHALGFGIPFRNRGGLYAGGTCTPIVSVKVEYLDEPPPDFVTTSGRAQKFYHRWIVKARTPAGQLEYVGTREGPPPSITGNMMYYYFTFEGSYLGESISGRGYAEYLSL